MIFYKQGDATRPQSHGNKIIAHICNDAGRWGAGFTGAISKRWDFPQMMYRAWYQDGQGFELGTIQLVNVAADIWVANMVAQHGLRKQKGEKVVDYTALEQALESVADEAIKRKATVHMPKIGTGLGGGDWDIIVTLVIRAISFKGVPVYVYEKVS